MAILITGGNGYLAQELARTLLTTDSLEFEELLLVDINDPTSPVDDPRVRCATYDLTEESAIEHLLETPFDVIFHLAGIMSAHSEKDIDLGHRVNVQSTHRILEAIRHRDRPKTRLVFTSSLAVYGNSELFDRKLSEFCALLPQTSYGSQKAISELLINDYTRKGFIDGRCVRLPTITVRTGAPNLAATYFIQGVVKNPLDGKPYVCPVSRQTKVWVSSPETLVKNLIHASKLAGDDFGPFRNVNLPGITTSVEEMLDCLKQYAGPETVDMVSIEVDEEMQRINSSFPPFFEVERALSLGFHRDEDYSQILINYMTKIGRKVYDSSSSSSSSSSSDEE